MNKLFARRNERTDKIYFHVSLCNSWYQCACRTIAKGKWSTLLWKGEINEENTLMNVGKTYCVNYFRAAFGKNLNPCSSKSVGIHFHAEKDIALKTAIKIDTKTFYHVNTRQLLFIFTQSTQIGHIST